MAVGARVRKPCYNLDTLARVRDLLERGMRLMVVPHGTSSAAARTTVLPAAPSEASIACEGIAAHDGYDRYRASCAPAQQERRPLARRGGRGPISIISVMS